MQRFPAVSKEQAKLFRSLNSPAKIQDFLNTLRMRTTLEDPIVRSPKHAVLAGEASCMEGALIAAAALAHHGAPALLLDLKVAPDNERDTDHVVALYTWQGYYGAISKTSHAVLRYREPVYKTIRELVLSYFHEYFLDDGVKTLRSFSKPFNIKKQFGFDWITSDDDLFEIACALDDSPHEDILPKGLARKLRKADPIEIEAGKLKE